MATLTLGTTAKTGYTLSATSAAGGGDVANNANGDTLIYVNNGSGSPITVTITAQNTAPKSSLGTLTIVDLDVTVAAGAERILGPFNPTIWNNSSNQLEIGYSSATSVTVAAFRPGAQ